MKKKTFPRIPEKFKRPLRKWTCKGSSILLGSLLSVNLILEVKGGELLLEKKVRKIQKCREYIKNELEKITKSTSHVPC